MLYGKAKIQNGKIEIVNQKEIDQDKLTSDCWLIQFNGLQACDNCKLRNTDDCGGGETLLKKLLDNH